MVTILAFLGLGWVTALAPFPNSDFFLFAFFRLLLNQILRQQH